STSAPPTCSSSSPAPSLPKTYASPKRHGHISCGCWTSTPPTEWRSPPSPRSSSTRRNGTTRSRGTRSWSRSNPITPTLTTAWASSRGPGGIRPTARRARTWGCARRNRDLSRMREIRPDYDDAMAYMNLLIRERADLRDTAEECQRDVRIADEWVQKALATKKAKAGGAAGGGGGGRIVYSPTPAEAPQRIRVVGVRQPRDEQPTYPALAKQARIEGVVRLDVVIDQQGRVSDIKVISGHPLLIPAAMDFVKQREYVPTLLNGQPIAVVTEMSIPFKL